MDRINRRMMNELDHPVHDESYYKRDRHSGGGAHGVLIDLRFTDRYGYPIRDVSLAASRCSSWIVTDRHT